MGMTLLVRRLVVLLTCWVFVGAYNTGNWSTTVLDFLHIFNGDWDNKIQVERGSQRRPFFPKRYIPVDVPALRPAPVVYVEVAMGNQVIVRNLAVITEGIENTLYLTLYNFTSTRRYSPKEFNVASLVNLRRQDLQHQTGCMAFFEPLSRGVYVGSWPNCLDIVNGVTHSYSQSFSCNFHLSFPLLVGEPPAELVSYKNYRSGGRFPVPNVPANYVSPCTESRPATKC